MRIAILNNVLPTADALGGSARIAFTYAELLRARGHEVQLFGPRAEFAEIGRMDLVTRLAFHAQDLVKDEVRAQEIVAWKPDVLFTHNLTGCGFKTPRIVADHGVRWVHMLHDVQLFEPSGRMMFGEWSWLRWPLRMAASLLRQSAMQNPDAVISPTQWLLDVHKKYWLFDEGVKTVIIPNPASHLARRTSEATSTLDARRATNVLFVGRVDADKGINVLLDAWKEIPAPALLRIVGDGSLQTRIGDQKIDRVCVDGPKPPEEVAALMRQSDVVVVPSLVLENQPTVILEALAAGCRVVASDVGGVRETLENAGWIVRPNDAHQLAVAIQDALSTTELRPQTAQEILAQHDPAMCVEKLLRVLILKT